MSKKITVLLSKPQKNYLVRNLSRIIESTLDRPDNDRLAVSAARIVQSLKKLEPTRILELLAIDAVTVISLCKTSMTLLTMKVIPEYKKRGNLDNYIRRAERKLKEITALYRKVDKKLGRNK